MSLPPDRPPPPAKPKLTPEERRARHADRLLGVACVLLRRQVLFDPDHGKPVAA